jgi:ABC-type sulfate transport system permease component
MLAPGHKERGQGRTTQTASARQADLRGSGAAFIAAIAIDGVLILLTLSYASWRRIKWESFLHPHSYLGGAGASLRTAFALAALELPLGFVLAYISLTGIDCSNISSA